MKKVNLRIAVFALISIFFAISCERTDFDELRNLQEEQKVQLKDHEARIKTLEELERVANTDIQNIQKLIAGLQKKISIVSYKALEDKSGYELLMSDGSTIILTNGKDGAKGEKGEDGKSSEVNVKQHTDGMYYWTLNGEWLLDGKGNKIPTTGKDGKDGKDGEDGEDGKDGESGTTPQLRVNTANHWEVSTDGGTTWQEVTDSNGNPVPATGKDGKDGKDGADGANGTNGADGDAQLDISEDEHFITIVYKGETYRIPKGEFVKVTGVTVAPNTLTLAEGATQTLTATVAPDNATNKDVTWSSSDTAVATVDANGKVTAVAEGTATITVTTADGGFTATCELTVTKASTDRPFITVWDTEKRPVEITINGEKKKSTNTQIYFPGVGENYTIQWEEVGDPTHKGELTNQTSTLGNPIRIDFGKKGKYIVKVLPKGFKHIQFAKEVTLKKIVLREDIPIYGDAGKFTEIQQWGDIVWTTMNSAFVFCYETQFTATDVPNLSKLTNMHAMFAACPEMNTDISAWDVSKVTDMSLLFFISEFNQPLNDWDVSNVTNMSGMFAASQFNQPLDKWKTKLGKVTDMSAMFAGCRGFNQDLSEWDVSNVTNMMGMFGDARTFNADLSKWNVSKVTNMAFMFVRCPAFNQDLSQWNLKSVKETNDESDLFADHSLQEMFDNSGMSCENYGKTLVGWAANTDTPNDLKLGAKNIKYGTFAKDARTALEGKGWIITDAGEDTNCGGTPPSTEKIVMKTQKAVGEKINLWIYAATADQAGVWIDLNNNSTKDNGEAVTTFGSYVKYTLGAQTVTIYGKVTWFNCPANELETLDVSKNKQLTDLGCIKNQLKVLDISENKQLINLYCFENQLKALNVSNNKVLAYLECNSNQLTELNVSQNSALKDLNCSDNPLLTKLNVANHKNGNIEEFKATNCPQLTCIKVDNDFTPDETKWKKDATANYYDDNTPCGGTPPSNDAKIVMTTDKGIDEKIGLRINAAPTDQAGVWIDLNNNGTKDNGEAVTKFSNHGEVVEYTLGAQTVTIYGKVTRLYCYDNQLGQLDITKNTELKYLSCGENKLTQLDVSKNTQLEKLYCSSNQLGVLDVSANTKLIELGCYKTQLKALDVTKNTALTKLDCFRNSLGTLNVSNNTQLTELDCSSNALTELNITNNTQLTSLTCDFNQLKTLDVSNNEKLTYLKCSFNDKLKTINVANNNNANFKYPWSGDKPAFNATNCPLLTCIKVDNGFDPAGQTGEGKKWKKDDTANYRNDGSDCP